MIDKDQALPLKARVTTELGGPETVWQVMYAPGGVQQICCGLGDEAFAEVWLNIDRETAGVLQASLAALNAQNAPQRAYFDEHHEHRDAMAWPTRFEWRENPAPGAYAVAEYSSIGREKVEGKVLRAFSGSFFTDAALPKRSKVRAGQTYVPAEGTRGSEQNPARIVGLDFPCAGTFTNNPAFRQILPLWASAGSPGAAVPPRGGNGAQPGAGEERKHERAERQNSMANKTELQAKKTALEQEVNVLNAAEKNAENAEALQVKQAELSAVNAQLETAETAERNAQLEAALLEQRKKDARAAVQAAVKRGVFAVKDEAMQAKWEKKCIEDPENIELLASMRGSPALEPTKLRLSQVQIVRESSLAVLNAFAAERDPLKRTVHYAEIKKRLAEGDNMPLQATVTAGTLSGTLVTQRTLELLKLQFPVLGRITTDFSDQPAVYNQAITTRIVSIPNVQTYNTSTGWGDSDFTTTDKSVTLNRHKGVPITFNAQILASTVRRLFDEIAPAQAYALAKDLVDALYAVIVAANFTNVATMAAQIDFGRPKVIEMGVALTKRGNPIGPINRALLLNADYYGQLAKDQAIVTLAAFQQAGIITGGQLPDVHGFNVIEAPNLPSTANLVGFGFSRSALVLAARLDSDYTSILPGASYGNVTVVTDPDIALSVLQVQYVNHLLATATQRISLLSGVAAGQDNAGQLLVSA